MTIGRLTVFESPRVLAKRWSLDDEGRAHKTTAAQMARGTYRVTEFGSVGELKELVESISTFQTLCCSLPINGSKSGRVVTQKTLAAHPGAVARTKASFSLAAQPGLLFLDCDEGGITRDELWQMLVAAVPGLRGAGVVWRPSGSSHVFNGDADITGLRGQHLYVMIADASDGPRVVKVIAKRLWLAGRGCIQVSSSGSLLARCPIDTAPADAARLIFAGGADCVSPLEQRRGPAVVLSAGGFLDSASGVPDLTADEMGRVDALIEQSKLGKSPEAAQKRAEYRSAMVAKLVPKLMREGVNASEAEQRVVAAVDAAYGGVLLGDFELTAVDDDGSRQVVTVAQVLGDRERWHEVDVLDPINPEHRGGAADGRLYLHGTSPIVYSLDDGGRVWKLRAQRVRIEVARGCRGDLVAQLAEVVAGLDSVYLSDAGPVEIADGKRWPLTVERLMNLVGREVVLVAKNKSGDVPTDLTPDVARLVLAALPHAGGVWSQAA